MKLARFHPFIVIISCFLCLAPASFASDASLGMPDTFKMAPEDDYPSWVAAHRVFDDNGQIDAKLFSPSQTSSLERRFNRHPGGKSCKILAEEIPPDGGDEPAFLKKTLADAGWIFFGTITGYESGFNQSLLGTVFRIEPDEVLRGPEDRMFPHYFFLPVGNFSIGPYAYCVSSPRFPETPQVGDRILLMLRLGGLNRDEFLWDTHDHQIFILEEDGNVTFSPRYTKLLSQEEAEKFDVLDELKSLLAAEPGHARQ